MANDSLLRKIYYDPAHHASFSSADRLFQAARLINRDLSRRVVDDFLRKQHTYTLHKRVVRNFPRRRMVASFPHEHYQMDLADMTAFRRKNNGFGYLLCVIDVFTKKASVRAIKFKQGQLVADALADIFAIDSPLNMYSDRGKEFQNQFVRKVCADHGVNHFFTRNITVKAACVERFNRTLKGRMYKYFTASGTQRYIDVLPKLVLAYNNAYHSAIKMKPTAVGYHNAGQVFRNMYGYTNAAALSSSEQNALKLNKAGETVLIPYKHEAFNRGFLPNWKDEKFTVVKRFPHGMYQIKNARGRVLEQRFYPQEVQPVATNSFRIERIIRKDYVNRKALVKFLGYDSTYNEWVSFNDITAVN